MIRKRTTGMFIGLGLLLTPLVMGVLYYLLTFPICPYVQSGYPSFTEPAEIQNLTISQTQELENFVAQTIIDKDPSSELTMVGHVTSNYPRLPVRTWRKVQGQLVEEEPETFNLVTSQKSTTFSFIFTAGSPNRACVTIWKDQHYGGHSNGERNTWEAVKWFGRWKMKYNLFPDYIYD